MNGWSLFAGGYVADHGGWTLHLDRPATRLELGVAVAAIRHFGLTPDDVYAVTLHPDGCVDVRHWDRTGPEPRVVHSAVALTELSQ